MVVLLGFCSFAWTSGGCRSQTDLLRRPTRRAFRRPRRVDGIAGLRGRAKDVCRRNTPTARRWSSRIRHRGGRWTTPRGAHVRSRLTPPTPSASRPPRRRHRVPLMFARGSGARPPKSRRRRSCGPQSGGGFTGLNGIQFRTHVIGSYDSSSVTNPVKAIPPARPCCPATARSSAEPRRVARRHDRPSGSSAV